MHTRTVTSLAAMLLTIVIGAAILVGASSSATSQVVVSPIAPSTDENFVPATSVRCGTGILQVLGSNGPEAREFPLKHTKVKAQVSGAVSRVQVTQVFANPYDETIAAVYVFPLPHEAAVTDMEMRLGERVVRGLIAERDAARRIYEQALSRGQVAALLEEERPNIFTQSVANILPGSEISITITYVEQLDSQSGTWEFAFPMVVGPRYTPPVVKSYDVMPIAFPQKPAPPATGGRINPPFLPPSLRSGHDIELTLDLEVGVAINNLQSPTHVFTRQNVEPGKVRIRLHPADTIPNKDFVLRWDIDADGPETAVLTHHDATNGYVSVVVHPKRMLLENEITPKEMVFVLDCSGSMRGAPMAAAKALARRALLDMGPRDSFQIIRFSTRASGFSQAPVAATPENVRRGLAYLDGLSGTGGTHMIEGIDAALGYPSDPNRLRIVMFLTDGYIGNENEILAAVRDRVGAARLFAFGVGSSVNRFLLEEMAREGRGAVQYQLAGSNAAEEVETFYQRIRHPYLTDIAIDWRGVDVVDTYPARIPDLFEGRPLILRGRYAQGGVAELRIRGKIAGQSWERRITVDLPNQESGNPATGSLWARWRIADLERSMRHGKNQATVDAITSLGLAHRLVTPWTSFVAVEEQLVVSNGQPRKVQVPVNLPEGVSLEGVFGGESDNVHSPQVRGRYKISKRAVSRGFPHAASPPPSPEARTAARELRLNRSQESVGQLLAEDAAIDVDALAGEEAEKKDGSLSPRSAVVPGKPLQQGGNLAIGMTVLSDAVSPDGTITLRIVFTNRGVVPIEVPAANALVLENLGLRAIGASWEEVRIGETASLCGWLVHKLAPGAVMVYEVKLPVALLGRLAADGVVHLVMEGARWGSADTVRATVRIRTL